jgi:hypothetical protein
LWRATVFVGGNVGQPLLNYPAGIAGDRDHNVWRGGETGRHHRIAADRPRFVVVTSTGGLIRRIAFDHQGRLDACNLR